MFVKENFYLIIPAFCIVFWAILCLIQKEFVTMTGDFRVHYNAGRVIHNDPRKIYDVSGFLYLPSYAVLFSVTISLLPYSLAPTVFYIINYIAAVLALIEYNKILKLMNVKEKNYRFIFLMVISNGFFVYNQFFFNQHKYILFLILLFILRRELEFNKYEKIKDLKYYLINYNLFIFALAIAPYFFYLLLIYVFQDISRNEILKKKNIQTYCLVAGLFVAQNFLFILYPELIFGFIDGLNHPAERNQKLKLIYLREFVNVSANTITILGIISNIILFALTIFLIYCKNKFSLIQKFGYFCIAYVFIGVYAY
ncbi:MAG: hypothetical protein ACFFAO_13860, partial [Candidatus Hermodarchaeota archaeon]